MEFGSTGFFIKFFKFRNGDNSNVGLIVGHNHDWPGFFGFVKNSAIGFLNFSGSGGLRKKVHMVYIISYIRMYVKWLIRFRILLTI